MARLLQIGFAFWLIAAASTSWGAGDECACDEAISRAPHDCSCQHPPGDELPCSCCDVAETGTAESHERVVVAAPTVSVRSVTTLPAGGAPTAPRVTAIELAVHASLPAGSRAPPIYLLVTSFLT